MYGQMIEYCPNIVENFCIFLYQFLLTYKSYVFINIAIIIINVALLRTVKHYMSKRRVKRSENVKMFKTKIGKKSQIKQMKYPRFLMYSIGSPHTVRQKHETSFGNNKNNKSTTTTLSRGIKETGIINLVCSNFAKQAAEVQTNATGMKQTNCDETLDEITWGCDDSQSLLMNMENAKFCDNLVQTQSKEIMGEEFSTFCIKKVKNIDVCEENASILNQNKEEQDRKGMKENFLKKEYMKQEVKERDKNVDKIFLSGKSNTLKKRSEKLKPKRKKVTRDGMTPLQSNPSRQSDAVETTKCAKVEYSDKQLETSPPELAVVYEGGKTSVSIHKDRRVKKKQLSSSPRTVESAKNSDIGSQHSDEQCDPDIGGSDQQFQGNRSESSLVCKRDSWIWFSPEMRPSVEDFAARQRKFKSRDPRVAELAVEISRQEEMNRDIERAAESLIDSSSPSTCKLQEASLRVVCMTEAHRRSCGAIKSRVGRQSRITPYTLPSKKLVAKSPASAAETAVENHERTEQLSTQKVSPAYKLTKLVKTSPEKQSRKVPDMLTPSPKRRKLRQKSVSQSVKNRNRLTNFPEIRDASSASSEHAKHSVQSPLGGNSLYWYNSPAAKVIRQPFTACRYSPLYDNSTLVSSTQCSMCSLDSETQESAKVISKLEKGRSVTADWTDESSEHNVSTQKQNCDTNIVNDLIHSSSESNEQKGRSVRPQTRLTSPKRRRNAKQNSVITPEVKEVNPESSNVPERNKEKRSVAQRLSKSAERISPTTKRLSSYVYSKSHCLTLNSRPDSIKTTRRSPQMAISTGESESESANKDKSGGLDASYRQCLISKEVNTTVQRLLFDTEKSSSSHSPSSKSKNILLGINADEEYNPTDDYKNITATDTAQFLETTTSESNYVQSSPPDICTNVSTEKQEVLSDRVSSDDQQRCDVSSQPTSLNLSQTESHSSLKKIPHKTTNIYTRDYYLGKRIALKKHLESKRNSNTSRWKKNDVTWAKTVSFRLYSPRQIYSGSAVPKVQTNKSMRMTANRKPCLKLTSVPKLQSQNSITEGCQAVQSCSSVPTSTISNNQSLSGDSEERDSNLIQVKSSELNPGNTHSELDKQQNEKVKVAFSERLEAPCHPETCAKKPNLKKSFSPAMQDNQMCPGISPCRTSQNPTRTAAATKEEGVQLESTKLLVTGSTNNSSSNLSYCSDKSESSGKQHLPTQTAQFYFVTQTKLNPEKTYSDNSKFSHLGLADKTHIDMFENAQISIHPLKSCTYMKPDLSMIDSDFKIGNSSEVQETLFKECVMNPLNSEHIANASTGNIRELHVRSLPALNAHLGGEHLGYNQQYKHVPAKNGMFRVEHPTIPLHVVCSSRLPVSLSCNNKLDVLKFLPQFSKGEGEESQHAGCEVREGDWRCTAEKSIPAIANTFENGQCNSLNPITTSAIKNNSNPDSGYDESLSEKANVDSSFQFSCGAPFDSLISRIQWSKLQIDKEQLEKKFESVSPCSCVSHSSDFAHRSRISNEWDSEQDTLPSLSDDAFQSSNNHDLMFNRSPSRSCKSVQDISSCAFSRNTTEHEIDEDPPVEDHPECSITDVSPCHHGQTCKQNKINFERKPQSNQSVFVMENKDLLLSETSSTTTYSAAYKTALDPLLTKPINKTHAENFQGITSEPKETAVWYSDNWDPKNASSLINDCVPAHISVGSCSQVTSFKESSLEEEEASDLLMSPQCDVNFFPRCKEGILRTPKSPRAELFTSLPNPANTSNMLDSTVLHFNQPAEDCQNYQAGTRNIEYSGSLLASGLCRSQFSNKMNTSLKANMPSNWSSVHKAKGEVESLFKDARLPLRDNYSSCAQHFQMKETSEPGNGWHSHIPLDTSANNEDNFAQCIMLPSTSSDEEDFEWDKHLEKINLCKLDKEVNNKLDKEVNSQLDKKVNSQLDKEVNSQLDKEVNSKPDKEVSTFSYFSSRKTLSSISDSETYEQETSNQTESVHSTPASKFKSSRCKEYIRANSESQRNSKMFISSRSMAFSDILKRF